MVRRGVVFAALLVALLHPLSAAAVPGNTLHGTVTAAATGSPIVGICVDVSSDDPHAPNDTSAVTDVDGSYTLENMAPGYFHVKFTDCKLAVPRYAGKEDPSLVIFTDEPTDVDVSAALERAGTLTGALTDPVSSLPAPNVCVDVDPQTPGMTVSPRTDAAGRFRADGLAPGVVRVEFAVTCDLVTPYSEQWYHGKWSEADADPVTIVAGGTADVSETLLSGLVITGRVTDEQTGLPISGVCIYAAPTVLNQRSSGSSTDVNGKYILGGLDAGSYKVEFLGDGCSTTGLRYQNEWWNGKSSYASATPIAVSTSAPTTGISAALHRLNKPPSPPGVPAPSLPYLPPPLDHI